MIKIETNKKTRNSGQDGSFEIVLEPIGFLKQDCITKIEEHIGSQGSTIPLDVKTGFEELKEKLNETPKTMIFSKEASATLKKLTRKASRSDNQASGAILQELHLAERLTPPLHDDDSLTERVCYFLPCSIL